jgi:hypothetical protein
MRKLCVMILFVAGCGETNRDAIEKVKPDFMQMRARMGKIAAAIANTPLPRTPAALQVSPKPIFDSSSESNNSDIIAIEQLANVEAKPKMDLHKEGDLVLGLRWTGDHSPAAESMLDRREGKALEARLRAALAYKYLVVYRTAAITEPEVVDEHTFRPGQVALGLYLVDLANGDKISALGVAVGQTAPATSYAYKKGDDPKQALASFAHSSMYESVIVDAAAKLKETTGGRFVLQ